MKRVGVLVAGAGPTGLGAAHRLEEIGERSWLLVEAGSEAGGLAASTTDEHGFTWDLGGHVVFSHYDYFDRLLDSLLGDAWVRHERSAYVHIRGRFVPYPFQYNLWRLPEDELVAALRGLIRAAAAPAAPAADFREWILRSFGEELARIFFLPYNRKVWAYDPSALSTVWMGERVATVDLSRAVENAIRRRDEISWGPNSTFRFPATGGTGSIWRTLAARLPAERIRFGTALSSVDPARRVATLSDGSEVGYDRLVSSIPLDDLLRSLVGRADLSAAAQRLVFSSTHVVGVGLEGVPPEELRDKCWMYFPEPEVPFYRVTVFSRYSPANVPDPARHWSLMAEISESPEKPVDSARVDEETLEAFRRIGFVRSTDRVASLWHRRLPHGYPTPFVGRDRLLGEIESELLASGIRSRGRFGAWKYEVSNQDHSLMQGVEAIDAIFRGTPEWTFSRPELVNGPRDPSREPR